MRKDLQKSLWVHRHSMKGKRVCWSVLVWVILGRDILTSSCNVIYARVLAQMEEALRGAEECSCPLQCAAEVRSLAHLERHIDKASSSVVIIAFYSRVRSRCVQCVLPLPELCVCLCHASYQLASVSLLMPRLHIVTRK